MYFWFELMFRQRVTFVFVVAERAVAPVRRARYEPARRHLARTHDTLRINALAVSRFVAFVVHLLRFSFFLGMMIVCPSVVSVSFALR